MKEYDLNQLNKFLDDTAGKTAQRVLSGAQGEWSVEASGDNVAATVTKAAVAGVIHKIKSISASYSVALIGSLVVKEGATVVATLHIHNQRDIPFEYEGAAGAALSVELAASGTATQIGLVSFNGISL